jgi:hypothetical protein
MDKKKAWSIGAVVVGIILTFLGKYADFDFKGAVCGNSAPQSQDAAK